MFFKNVYLCFWKKYYINMMIYNADGRTDFWVWCETCILIFLNLKYGSWILFSHKFLHFHNLFFHFLGTFPMARNLIVKNVNYVPHYSDWITHITTGNFYVKLRIPKITQKTFFYVKLKIFSSIFLGISILYQFGQTLINA